MSASKRGAAVKDSDQIAVHVRGDKRVCVAVRQQRETRFDVVGGLDRESLTESPLRSFHLRDTPARQLRHARSAKWWVCRFASRVRW